MTEPILTLDKYHLTEVIGSGGMASVYRARITGPMGFEKPAAVKLLHSELSADRDIVRMFIDEARVGAQLSHPNVVSILDFGEIDGRYYIAMEFVDGVSLSTLMKSGTKKAGRPLPVEAAVCAVSDALEGLSYVHSAKDAKGRPLGIVHRDISPHNILLDRQGRAKIGDFGIATGQYRSEHTSAGVVKGKAAYMSAEQAAGKPLDARSDIAAAGLTLYALVAGQAAFSGTDTASVMAQAESGLLPESLDGLDCAPELTEVIAKAAAPKIQDRYQTAAEFREALMAAAPDPDGAGRRLLAAMVEKSVKSSRKPAKGTSRKASGTRSAEATSRTADGSPLPDGTITRRTVSVYRAAVAAACLLTVMALVMALFNS